MVGTMKFIFLSASGEEKRLQVKEKYWQLATSDGILSCIESLKSCLSLYEEKQYLVKAFSTVKT